MTHALLAAELDAERRRELFGAGLHRSTTPIRPIAARRRWRGVGAAARPGDVAAALLRAVRDRAIQRTPMRTA